MESEKNPKSIIEEACEFTLMWELSPEVVQKFKYNAPTKIQNIWYAFKCSNCKEILECA